ncbi:MAG: hypothetical protein ABIG66_00235 [Candidatus Kerfeldbacteria bacterium]
MPEEIDKEKIVEEWFEEKIEGMFKDKEGKGCKRTKGCKTSTGAGAGVYCIGFIGAAVYYISAATGFWVGVLGVLKACVWPAFLVHGLLTFLG